jgi:uncharacterized protein (TIGR03437 family)
MEGLRREPQYFAGEPEGSSRPLVLCRARGSCAIVPLRRFPRASSGKPMQIRHIVLLTAASISAFAQTTIFNSSPSRAFGHPRLTISSGAPNLVEGREFFFPQSVAIDKSSSPFRIYVADTVNNRVLGWRDISTITKGNPADIVIGQLDMLSTRNGGPGTPQTTGMTSPSAVAVDGSGNLYVADAANNRILRFPRPFAQTSETPQPDLVIGQRTLNSGNSANQGAGVPSAKTISLTGSGGTSRTGMAFDAQGNLWFSDAANNRVLRYPAAALAPGTIEPEANLVLGQQNFAVGTINDAGSPGNNNRLNKNTLFQPSGLAFSEAGDLYIADGRGRVLYFRGPIGVNGQPATRIIGLPTPNANNDPVVRAFDGCPPTPPQPCENALGGITLNNIRIPPEGVAVLNNSLYVADTGNHRIVKYDPPDRWPAECVFTGQLCPAGTTISPPGADFIGQAGGQSVRANRGGLPGADTLFQPVSLSFAGTDLWVADALNHRVLMLPRTGNTQGAASRVLGQTDFTFNAPNLVEGRELFLYDPLARSGGAGIAVDTTKEPPHLYIADTLNNRVLGFRDARKVRPGITLPDLVIGQPDLLTTSPNSFTRDADQPNEMTLISPTGLVVDRVGDLFVADSGNSRVLRFSRPFEQTGRIRANLVLGQATQFSKVTDPLRNQMRLPWGLAFTTAGHLVVSDAAHHRVLVFRKPEGGDFRMGQNADIVIGQSDYTSSAPGNSTSRFNNPRGIAIDTSDRLYVADAANNRISIFSGFLSGEVDPSARFTPSIATPQSVAVSAKTGEVWVTDLGNGRLLRFPIFEDWFLGGQPTGGIQTVGSPLAVALDASDNPIVAETVNRVSMYYPQAAFSNAASYVTRGLTPGGLSYFARFAPQFAPGTQAFAEEGRFPLPTTLGDIQLLLNGTPVPLFQVLPDRVSFQVPWSAPSTGGGELELVRASTGEVLAAGTFAMRTADPGFFTSNAQGFGQLAAINQDGTINSAANPAPRGSIISLFGTGIGPVDGAPPSGQVPGGAVPAPGLPRVSMANPGPGLLPDSAIKYFGLVTWFPGVFQLNVQIPDSVPPSNTVNVGLVWKDFFSTEGPTGRVITTIAVK